MMCSSPCFWQNWLVSFLMAQMVKNLLAVQETEVQYLGWKDPLEKRIATKSSILAWRIPWTEEPGGQESMGSQRVGHDWMTNRTTETPSRLPNRSMLARVILPSFILCLFQQLMFNTIPLPVGSPQSTCKMFWGKIRIVWKTKGR